MKMTAGCEACVELNPRPPANPQMDPQKPKGDLKPMESVGCDIFVWKGVYYFVCVDRLSGFIMIENMGKHATDARVTQSFKILCGTYG